MRADKSAKRNENGRSVDVPSSGWNRGCGEIKESVLGGRAGEQDKLRHLTAGLLYFRFVFFLRGSFLKENMKHKDCTPAYRVRLII